MEQQLLRCLGQSIWAILENGGKIISLGMTIRTIFDWFLNYLLW